MPPRSPPRPRVGRPDQIPSLRKETLELQREILSNLKARIEDLIGRGSPEIEAYRRSYEKVFEDYEGLASKREIVDRAKVSDLVFCGDYHTLEQAQKTNVKILREVVGHRTVILALEMVQAKDQKHLDAYLAGRLDERSFLARIDYEGTWGFPWKHYRLLFEFARAHGLEVVALNLKPPASAPDRLRRRDEFAAGILDRLLRTRPGALVWVVFGDLHCAPERMPAQVERRVRDRQGRCRTLLVYQNNKELYFSLATAGLLGRIDTVKLGPDRYCVINTPPWIKLQTFVDHLEARIFGSHQGEDSSPAYEDHVAALMKELAGFLGLPPPDPSGFHLYTPATIGPARAGLEVPGGPKARAALLEGASAHVFPEARVLYLQKADSNHSAEVASEYLHWLGARYPSSGRTPEDDFYLHTIRKALGYLGSKILNPKRKTDFAADHAASLARARLRGGRLSGKRRRRLAVARAVLRHEILAGGASPPAAARKALSRIFRADPGLGFGVSRALGFLLGERLYQALMEGHLTKLEIAALFQDPLAKRGSPARLYRQLRRRTGAVAPHFRSKDEFF